MAARPDSLFAGQTSRGERRDDAGSKGVASRPGRGFGLPFADYTDDSSSRHFPNWFFRRAFAERHDRYSVFAWAMILNNIGK